MPEYTYSCPSCFNTVEVIHSMKDCDNPVLCGKCSGTMRRIIGSPEFRVNGMNAAGGYSDTIGDIQESMGRKIENHDMDKHVSTLGKI